LIAANEKWLSADGYLKNICLAISLLLIEDSTYKTFSKAHIAEN
jgi:hypothetical protein